MTTSFRRWGIRVSLFLILLPFVLAGAGPALGAELPVTVGHGVLVQVDGDLVVEAGETAEAVIVVQGNATIRGTVRAVVVTGGDAIVESGGQVESIVVVGGNAQIAAGAIVYGDVRAIGGTVTADPNADIRGSIKGFDADVVGLQAAFAVVFSILYLGISILMIVSGVFLAGIASKQIRAAGAAISGEIPAVLIAGVTTWIGLPILAALLMVTIIGIPVGLALLVIILPAIWVLGYLTSGVLIGEWILTRVANRRPADRPFLGAFIGVLILQVFGFVPPIGVVAGLVGSSALALVAWRALRGRSTTMTAAPTATTGPTTTGPTSGGDATAGSMPTA